MPMRLRVRRPDEPGCFLGCQYGGAGGGIFRFLLPDMEAEFGTKNPKRCKYAELVRSSQTQNANSQTYDC